jgi:ribosomal protein RSM22 (predicted rRNA methylase)
MSQLPAKVREAVLDHAAAVPFSRLKLAAAQLSETYRAGKPTAASGLSPAERAAAYLAVRMPATYAAALEVFRQCHQLLEAASSLVDLGAGSGAATLAARQMLPSLEACTLIEADRALADTGRNLLPDARWQTAKLEDADVPAADVVVASYALNELPEAARQTVVEKAWAAARLALIVIEPGSPAGFGLTRAIRDRLSSYVVAPCPSTAVSCPMPADDWCHFAARVERTALHRQLKEGALSYEDEKFSYVALAKPPGPTASARLVDRPQTAPGLIQLSVCTGTTIDRLKVTKRDKAAFRSARKVSWGDPWP